MDPFPLTSRHRHITHARARCISLAVHQGRWAQARDDMSEPASGHGHFRLISATRAPKRTEVNAHLAVHTIGLAGSHQYAARSTCACGTPPSFARGTRRAAHLALKLRLLRSIFRSLLTGAVDSFDDSTYHTPLGVLEGCLGIARSSYEI